MKKLPPHDHCHCDYSHLFEQEPEECPDHPDLLLLRDAAADERAAIGLYLEAAIETGLTDLFMDIAEDEMHHYAEFLEQIAVLDPVQAKLLQKANLDMFIAAHARAKHPKWAMNQHISKGGEYNDETIPKPSKKEMSTIKFLTRSIIEELQATNKYQRYMMQARTPAVQALFCHIMNEEKDHIARYTAAIYDLTQEPPPSHD